MFDVVFKRSQVGRGGIGNLILMQQQMPGREFSVPSPFAVFEQFDNFPPVFQRDGPTQFE